MNQLISRTDIGIDGEWSDGNQQVGSIINKEMYTYR